MINMHFQYGVNIISFHRILVNLINKFWSPRTGLIARQVMSPVWGKINPNCRKSQFHSKNTESSMHRGNEYTGNLHCSRWIHSDIQPKFCSFSLAHNCRGYMIQSGTSNTQPTPPKRSWQCLIQNRQILIWRRWIVPPVTYSGDRVRKTTLQPHEVCKLQHDNLHPLFPNKSKDNNLGQE